MYLGRITSPASFDTTFYVGKCFMVDCPGFKLENSVKTHLRQILALTDTEHIT